MDESAEREAYDAWITEECKNGSIPTASRAPWCFTIFRAGVAYARAALARAQSESVLPELPEPRTRGPNGNALFDQFDMEGYGLASIGLASIALAQHEISGKTADELWLETGRLRSELADLRACKPINMVLHCPKCGVQHIDAPELNIGGCFVPAEGATHHASRTDIPCACGTLGCLTDHWVNPPHRSHLCHYCGHVWRPADVPTNGVATIKTKGKNDSERSND